MDGSEGAGALYQLRLLNVFELSAGGRTLMDAAWSRSKAKALVKLLALQPSRRLHRDQVLETLWPGLDESSAANNLYKNIHYVRSRLGPLRDRCELVLLDGGLVSLCAAAAVDVDRFRAAAKGAFASVPPRRALIEEALALCPGDLLPEDIYEPWTEVPREELRGLRLRLLIDGAAACEGAGDPGRAIELLQESLRVDPVLEASHRELMRLYAETGERERALRQYTLCRDALSREIGLPPSDETEALRARIADGEVQPIERPAPTMPPVRYVTTADGVRIAYCVHEGPGEPVMLMPIIPASHLTNDWTYPEVREQVARITEHHALVRYDARGNGLSQRRIDSFTSDGLVADMEAVFKASRVGAVHLIACHHSCVPAVRLAAAWPERVRSLVLWWPHADGAAYMAQPASQAMRQVMVTNWNLYAQTVGMLLTQSEGTARRLQEQIATSMDQDVCVRFVDSIAALECRSQLAAARCPTLVVVPVADREQPIPDSHGRDVANAIPNARTMMMNEPVFAHWTRPELSTPIILDFIASCGG